MKKTDINRVKLESGSTIIEQVNRAVVGNKLVFNPEAMSHKDVSKSLVVEFCKKFNVKAILHFNFDHYIITPEEVIDMGETKSYMANVDLIDESTEEMF